MEIIAVILVGLAVWYALGSSMPATAPVASSPGRADASGELADPLSAEGEGIWARHPLDPERGWCVATAAHWPVRPGDRIRVRRRDGSRSVEIARGVLLEFTASRAERW